MATLFQDTFNRADGAPANGWTVDQGTVDIYSNQLRFHGAGANRISRQVVAGAVNDFYVEVALGGSQDWNANPSFSFRVRSDHATSWRYNVTWLVGPLSTAYVEISAIVNLTLRNLGKHYQMDISSAPHTLGVRCQGTRLTAFLDGYPVLSIDDDGVASGQYIEMTTTGADKWYIDTFTMTDAPQPGMYIVPGYSLPSLAGQQFYLYGASTQWSPGTPGDPEFTVSDGSITSQTIETGDRALLTMTLPNNPCIVTVHDPNYNRDCYLYVTLTQTQPAPPSTLPSIPPWLMQIAQALAILLDPIGAAVYDALLLDVDESLLGYARRTGEVEFGDTLASLLYSIQNEVKVDDDDPATLRHISANAVSMATDILAELYYITGYPTTHTTLQDVIDAIGEGSNQEVLAAISALSDLTTLVLGESYFIDGYPARHDTIYDVLQAIAGLSFPDLGQLQEDVAAILTKVDALDGDGSKTVVEVWNEAHAASGYASTAATQSTAAAISAAAAVVAIALTEGVILKALVAQTIEINGAIGVAAEAITGAVAALGEALALQIGGVGSQVTALQADVDTANGKLDTILANLAALQNTDGKWPGIAGVQNTETTELTESGYVARPCDGVIVDVMTYPPSRLYWTVGPATNLQYAGFVAFVGANGYMDDRQPIQFTHEAYRPISVRRPAGVAVRLAPGVTANVTTWDYA
jgi:hypothetical protein